jgi:hypothetical protein
MASMRSQVISAFCTKIGGQRALPFASVDDLPLKSVWDLGEEATRVAYGAHDIDLTLEVQMLLDSSGSTSTEPELLDAALLELQTSALSFEETFFNLVESIQYSGCQFGYSEDGSAVIGLSASFLVQYRFLTSNPSTN